MTDEPDDELEQIEASMTATEFFRLVEMERDSKRVYDFWFELDNSVLEIKNPKDIDGDYE